MLFNSLEFAIFLPLVFAVYWLLNKSQLQFQNIFLIAASYLFYGWIDIRYLSLIVLSSLVDYIVGCKLEEANKESHRKWLLAISIFVNLGALMFFKYCNFFIENFQLAAETFFGAQANDFSLKVILPVGISFYTFQTMSYSIDVYRRTMKPTYNFFAFLAYVSFFPQLVAGPIERAQSLLPQFTSKRTFDLNKSRDGLRQILWGLFKKIVVADNCAILANQIFNNYEDYTGITLFLGAVLFAFQIYGDFSGYSDIAIGTARLFGFNLRRNFAFPYFATNMAEFWKRWHISLTSWFRDYVYIPLGGSRGGIKKVIRNTFIIFLVSGFWHGANWTFIMWGFLNALYFVPTLIRRHDARIRGIKLTETSNGVLIFVKIIFTFSLTCLAWVFFRAQSIFEAKAYLKRFASTLFENPGQPLLFILSPVFIFILILLIVEWIQREKEHGLEFGFGENKLRWLLYVGICAMIWLFGPEPQEFIYFQF